MQDLLNIKNELIGGVSVQAVSARELYLGVGLNETHWKRWADKNIVNNDYFKASKDWVVIAPMAKTTLGGRPLVDYAVSIDFAKLTQRRIEAVK